MASATYKAPGRAAGGRSNYFITVAKEIEDPILTLAAGKVKVNITFTGKKGMEQDKK